MDRFQSLLGAEIAARRAQIIIVEDPDQGRPGAIHHLLEDPGGGVLVAAIGFIHGALAIIVHSLPLHDEIFYTFGRRRNGH